jgi:8-amino-3,8-dideoxy-alpha-D-manno-octulosonate transaminase
MNNQSQDRDSRGEPVLNRRRFLASATTGATGLLSASYAAAAERPSGGRSAAFEPANMATIPAAEGRLALDGGTPVRATKLKPNFPGPLYYDEQERQELAEVLERRAPFRWYGIGPKGGQPLKCDQFEKEFAEHQHTRYCVAVTSGTMALYTAIAALGVGPGDEVILPTWTWYSCYNAIVAAGGTPVFAEIDESFDIDPAGIEKHITPRTKVIMAVHISGEPADMDPILNITRRHKLKVLEDCAQSSGAKYKGRPIGSMGNCGIYSFQECKTISAGEGGAVVTSDPYLFERAARYHDLGLLRGPHADWLGSPPRLQQLCGGQFRMSEFTGAVMRAQLRKLDRIVTDFRTRADRVTQGIQDLPGICFRRVNDAEGSLPSAVYFRANGKAQRDWFIKALNAENVSAGKMEGSEILPLVPYIENKQTVEAGWPSFASPWAQEVEYGRACCERTLDIYDRYVGIMIDPTFSNQDVNDVIAAIRKVYRASGTTA